VAHGAAAFTEVDPARVSPALLAKQARLTPLVMSLFFAFGFCTVLVDTLIPKLKAVFALSYVEVMMTQFCFFFAYFVVSIPAGWLMTRLGYLRGIAVGLVIMAAGCLLFTPAADIGLYPAFLAALFILAGGITVVQVAANPLAASLGDPARAHSRLTLAQAFNSVGTFIGPIFGSALILAGGVVAAPKAGTVSQAVMATFRKAQAHAVQLPFMIIATAILLLAAVVWMVRKAPAPAVKPATAGSYGRLLTRPRVSLGALSIFLYVGAEVSIGSTMINFLTQPLVIGTRLADIGAAFGAHVPNFLGGGHALSAAQMAGTLVSLYWGGAMVGRFAGSQVLRRVAAGTVLCVCAVIACLLATCSAWGFGDLAAIAVIAIGLFNSIMFPTIFTLAIEDLGEDAAQASGLICLAIVGGALVPLLTGFVADHAGLSHALMVPAICYVWIATYGVLARTGRIDRHARRETLGEVLG
jgi:FHS family L-fucose permease-like MFS transporter